MRRTYGRDVLLGVAVVAGLLCGCQAGSSSEPGASGASKAETSVPPRKGGEAGRPVRQGFTQPPPRDAGWLPPPPPPLLTGDEAARAKRAAETVTPVVAERARAEIDALLEAVAAAADAKRPIAPVVSALRERARRAVLEEGLEYARAETLHGEYLFPNDPAEADARRRGKPVVLEGRVAPEHMLNPADGFKLFEQEPYVHEPVLLSTDYEFTFVRCHLLRPEAQRLSDWQNVQIVGIVDGKRNSDVVLRRCVVL